MKVQIETTVYEIPEHLDKLVTEFLDHFAHCICHGVTHCPNCAKYDHQTEKLANFIMGSIPGEPARDEGAIDCAIRLLRDNLGKGYTDVVHVAAPRGTLGLHFNNGLLTNVEV